MAVSFLPAISATAATPSKMFTHLMEHAGIHVRMISIHFNAYKITFILPYYLILFDILPVYLCFMVHIPISYPINNSKIFAGIGSKNDPIDLDPSPETSQLCSENSRPSTRWYSSIETAITTISSPYDQSDRIKGSRSDIKVQNHIQSVSSSGILTHCRIHTRYKRADGS